MNNTKRVDTGFAYWIVPADCNDSIESVYTYIVSHGYTPGDGTTFIIIHPSIMTDNDYLVPAYGDPLQVAAEHAALLEAYTYTVIDYQLDILDMTKYTISPSGEVLLDGIVLPMSLIDAAFSKAIQYNRGDPILTFKALTSYILSRYDWRSIGMVMCDNTHKYSVRKISGGPLHILPGILLYERE